jgi:hypothetical protein
MNLTNPPLLVYEEELPADKVDRHYYLELVSLLQKTKAFFNDFRFWEVFRVKLETALRIVSFVRPPFCLYIPHRHPFSFSSDSYVL